MTTLLDITQRTRAHTGNCHTTSQWIKNPYKEVRDTIVGVCIRSGYRLFTTQVPISAARSHLISQALLKCSEGYANQFTSYGQTQILRKCSSSVIAYATGFLFKRSVEKVRKVAIMNLSDKIEESLRPLFIELESSALTHPIQSIGKDMFDLGAICLVNHGLHMLTPQLMEDHKLIDPSQWIQTLLFTLKSAILCKNLLEATILYKNYNESELKKLAIHFQQKAGLSPRQADLLSFFLGDCLRKTIKEMLGVRSLKAFDNFLKCETKKQCELIQSIGQTLLT